MKDCTGRELEKYDIVSHSCNGMASRIYVMFGRIIDVKENSCKLQYIVETDNWDTDEVKEQGYRVKEGAWLKSSDRIFKISGCEDFFAFNMIKDSYVKQEVF